MEDASSLWKKRTKQNTKKLYRNRHNKKEEYTVKRCRLNLEDERVKELTEFFKK